MKSIPVELLNRAADILADAPPGRVIATLAAHPDREAAEVAIVACDVEGGVARRAAEALRRTASESSGALVIQLGNAPAAP